MTHRKGYTLIELMIGLVILGMVTGALYKLLVTSQRVSRAQTEHVDIQTNMRGAALLVPNELREINTVVGGTADQNDILVGNATQIQYRAMRGIGFVCQTPTSTEVRILASTWAGLRAPDAARDDGYVFIDGDENKSADDVWQPVIITAVNAASTCGGQTAYALTINPAVAALTAVPVNTPVRLYEVMELSMYASGGQWWLGSRSVSGGEVAPQPLVGPLDPTANAGFNLSYRDGTNTVTADLKSVKSIRIGMKGLSSYNVASGTGSTLGQLQETDSTQVVLRNAFRP
jgi:prepilin-type N-terminal cleavage/methylation domain-containing protein